ncbi:MAG: YlxR family protein [Clostridiales Family XIII bacterium]|nr:YlxR family protein [Clostridiales Family XIII bacterium]
MRRCVGCMESKPKKELLRIAAADGGVFVDVTGKANGRGIYLCRREACFDAARKKKALGRGLGIENPDVERYEKLKEEFMTTITDEEATE